MDGQSEVSVLAAGKKKEDKPKANQTDKSTTSGKRSTGLIVTLIIIIAMVIAAGIVLAVILIAQNSNNSGDKGGDEKTAIVEDKKEKPRKKKTVVDTSDDNAEIEKPSAANGNIGDYVRGKRSSKVLVIEYADMQCPGCANMMSTMESIYKKYSDKVAFVYRHYPLASHRNAEAAAIAVEAAGKQGYFWEMLTEVFSRRSEWISLTSSDKLNTTFAKLFSEISDGEGDLKQFRADLNDSDIKKKVAHDKSLGRIDNVNATPTIIVNGKAVDFATSRTYAEIQSKISSAIEDALDDNTSDDQDDDDDDEEDDEEDDEDDDEDEDEDNWGF